MVTQEQLVRILKKLEVPDELAYDLVKYFLQITNELREGDLEKSSAGKFVETVVQILQALDPKKVSYDRSVKNVDVELNKTYTSRTVKNIPSESLIPITRVARAIYCLRNKRSIVHKNEIDPNIYDLEFIYHASQWIMTEFVRLATDLPLEEAKLIIEDIQQPVYPFIQNIMGRPLVLDGSLTVEEEILLVLYIERSRSPTSRRYIGKALDRRSPSAVTKALQKLWKKRMVEGNGKEGYILTKLGLDEARKVIKKIM